MIVHSKQIISLYEMKIKELNKQIRDLKKSKLLKDKNKVISRLEEKICYMKEIYKLEKEIKYTGAGLDKIVRDSRKGDKQEKRIEAKSEANMFSCSCEKPGCDVELEENDSKVYKKPLKVLLFYYILGIIVGELLF